MVTLSDIQSILNSIPIKSYQKAFNNEAPFFKHLPVKASVKGEIGVKYHYAGNSGGGSFAEGDDLTIGGKQSRKTLHFPWKRVYKPISVDGLVQAISKNGGVLEINDMVKQEVFDATKDLVKDINTMLMGDGTGNSGKDVQGIKYHIADSGNYSNEALDRAVYAWLAAYINDNGGTLRDITEDLMFATHQELTSVRGVTYNQIWTNDTLAEQYARLMGDRRRFVNVKVGDLSIDAVAYKGRAIIPFPGYPNQMDFVMADDFHLEYLTQEAANSLGQNVKGMFKIETIPTAKDSTDLAVIAYLNLVCKNAYRQASLRDIQ
jgi:hypothetical protein